ncbi:MAG: hypothetical protein M3R08_07770 [Bacteroidota bacterium]|nr:hypothetical protein [Bacteroidota bacterium]
MAPIDWGWPVNQLKSYEDTPLYLVRPFVALWEMMFDLYAYQERRNKDEEEARRTGKW